MKTKHWIIIILFLTAVMITSWVSYFTTDKVINYNTMSLPGSIEKLKQTHNAYISLTGKQLHSIWNDIFFDVRYKLDGDYRDGEVDCFSSHWNVWNRMGGNVIFETTAKTEERLKRVSYIRKKFKDVCITDIIIFRKFNNIYHIASVERLFSNGFIRYVDVNAHEGGAGYNVVEFKDKRIKIYAMTLAYWAGNILLENK